MMLGELEHILLSLGNSIHSRTFLKTIVHVDIKGPFINFSLTNTYIKGEKLEREEVDILIKECCDPEDDDGFIPYERKQNIVQINSMKVIKWFWKQLLRQSSGRVKKTSSFWIIRLYYKISKKCFATIIHLQLFIYFKLNSQYHSTAPITINAYCWIVCLIVILINTDWLIDWLTTFQLSWGECALDLTQRCTRIGKHSFHLQPTPSPQRYQHETSETYLSCSWLSTFILLCHSK